MTTQTFRTDVTKQTGNIAPIEQSYDQPLGETTSLQSCETVYTQTTDIYSADRSPVAPSPNSTEQKSSLTRPIDQYRLKLIRPLPNPRPPQGIVIGDGPLLQLGFSFEQYNVLTDNLQMPDTPYFLEFCELAKKFIEQFPADGPAILLSEVIALNKRPGKSPLIRIQMEDLRNTFAVFFDLCSKGVTPREALGKIHILQSKSELYYNEIIAITARGEFSIEDALREAITINNLPTPARIDRQLFLRYANSGFTVEQARKMVQIFYEYNPDGWEGCFNSEPHSMHPYEIPSWGNTTLPEWLQNINLETLVKDLEERDIEPAEALGLLLNSQVTDMPSSYDNFVALLSEFNKRNGIERFARYSFKILNAVRHPIGGRKNTAFILSDSDWNGGFYNVRREIEEVIDHGHMLSLYEVATDVQLANRIEEAGRMVPIDLLVLGGHGDPLGMQLHSASLGFANFTSTDESEALRIGSVLSKGAQIVLFTCAAAKETWYTWPSFAQWLHDKTSAEVFANTQNGRLRYWTFKQDGGIDECIFSGETTDNSGTVIR